MSPRTIVGLVLLAIGSLLIGWYGGCWGFSVFESTVPPGMVTPLVRSATKGAYFTSGLVLGALVFGWTVLAAWLSPYFRGGKSGAPSVAPAK